jgi:hypothetical protein
VKFAVLLFAATPLLGQMCAPPAAIRPNATFAGTIDGNSCVLSDGTSFTGYAVTLPTRGNFQITLKGVAGFVPSMILRDNQGHQVTGGTSITHYSEAGSYVLIVDAARAKQTGSYSITTVFQPEPMTLCGVFTSIGVGQTINGNLSASSCKLPDQSAYDAHSVTVFGAGTITVTMTSEAFDAFVILRGDNGSLLAEADAGGAGNPASITLPVSGNDTYTIVAAAGSAAEPGGAYQLSTTFTPNADETCVSQGALDQNPTISGSVSISSCNFNLPNRQDSALFNFYTLHVSQTGMAQVSVLDSSFGPLLLLLDASGNPVAENAQGGGASAPLLRQELAAGDYTLVIFNQDSFEGRYNLQYSFTAGPAKTCAALTLIGSAPAAGALDGLASCLTWGFLANRYQFVLPVAGTVNIDLSSQDFTSLLFLEDSKNNAMYFGEDTTDRGDSHIQIRLPAGTYYAVAASADLPGGYTINYSLVPGVIPSCATAKAIPITNGASNGFNGTLSFAASCSGNNGLLSDFYSFTTTSGGTVAAVMISSDLDSLLFLTDSKGNELRRDNDSYSQSNAIIVDYLPAGTYKLQAASGGFQSTGSYQVDVLLTSSATTPKTCAPTTVATGVPVKELLSYTSCHYLDGTFADIFQVTVADASNPIDIAASSMAFDTYLILLDPKGNVVAIDDNSGGGANAHLLANVAPGAYFVVVKPASDPSSSGAYELTIQ